MIFIVLIFAGVGIIPWKVDVPEERVPVANWLIIGGIIVFFAWQMKQTALYHTTIKEELRNVAIKNSNSSFTFKEDIFNNMVLKSWSTRELFGYMWLHANMLHMFGNLYFLWIFGNSVCTKIGNLKFIILYVLFGVAAGAAHMYFSGRPAIGASGAINGVVGMYLVLFPTNAISCLFYFLPIGYFKSFDAASYVIILMFFIHDIIFSIFGVGNTAYFAHFGGFAAGVIMTSLLLLTGIIKMKRDEISIYKALAPKHAEPLKKPLYERILARDYETGENVQVSEELSASSAFAESLIHLQCRCGMKCKISIQHAGKTGKCPRCKQPVRIP
ncbi:MAG: rhomboid family intramembrane serine protease [Planctomycetaceae bacterium]|nr:rhomboid family intramembrane serine protease [Planctomycetaceae bacterium]